MYIMDFSIFLWKDIFPPICLSVSLPDPGSVRPFPKASTPNAGLIDG